MEGRINIRTPLCFSLSLPSGLILKAQYKSYTSPSFSFSLSLSESCIPAFVGKTLKKDPVAAAHSEFLGHLLTTAADFFAYFFSKKVGESKSQSLHLHN